MAHALDILLAILGSSVFTAIVNFISARQKVSAEVGKAKAETEQVVANTYAELIENLRKELAIQQAEIAKERTRFETKYEQWKELEDNFIIKIKELEKEKHDLYLDNQELQKKQ